MTEAQRSVTTEKQKVQSTTQSQNLTPAEMFDQYFGPTLSRPWARVLLQYAQPQPGECVLDLACGTGIVARQVAPLVGSAGRIVALDNNPAMLAVARKRPAPEGAPIEWYQRDAMSPELADGVFDLVLCQQGLQFFADRAAALGEMRRILTEDGRLALNLWQALHTHPVYRALCEAEARYLGVPLSVLASPWSLSDGGELRALLNKAGFKHIQIIPKSLGVHFPSSVRFVYLTLFAAQAILPQLDWEDEGLRSSLIETVSHEIEPTMERYRDGEGLSFSLHCNIALAHG